MAGDGSIRERKNPKTGKSYNPKRWDVEIACGLDPVTGKRKRIRRVIHGTKTEAREVRDKLIRECEGGLSVDDERMTFGEFADIWEQTRISAGELSASYLEREQSELKMLKSYIGNVRLRDLDAQAVEALYAKIRSDKIAKLGKYSGSTMNKLHKLLKQILNKAVDYDLILRNPCDRVKAPKRETPERRSLSQEDAARLLAVIDDAEAGTYEQIAAKEHRQTEWGNLFNRSFLHGLDTASYIQAVRLALATGMRRGEVFGLTWGCVDFQAKRIRVRQAVDRLGNLKEPKSKAGIRNIATDDDTLEHLRTWKEQQASLLKRLGISPDDDTLVCCSATGGIFTTANFVRWWEIFREAAGFPDLKFHELRHTQATLLLANGVDVKTVQTRLGHASAAMTLDCYAHAIPDNDEAAADTIANIFGQAPKEAEIVELKTA